MKIDPFIIGVAVSILLTLIGILYKIVMANIDSNRKKIDEIDKSHDNRMDNIEKDIIRLENRN